METKELKITIPEGYKIDKDKSTFEKIIFKKKDSKPRSWEEYERMVLKDMGYKDSSIDTISITFSGLLVKVSDYKFLQEHTAFIKLCLLRKAWIDDWEPNWLNSLDKWCIVTFNGKFDIVNYGHVSRSLNFPTKEMAVEFLDCFKDLLEIAEPLV